MNIAVTTDHAGFTKLAKLITYIESLGHTCHNFGPTDLNMDDDYPDFIFPAAQAVARGECDRAIIMGGSGQGEAIAANRLKGIRCALFYGPVVPKAALNAEGVVSDDPYSLVRLSREHNNTNVLSLGARFMMIEEMQVAVRIWLETEFSQIDRHERRVKKLDQEGS